MSREGRADAKAAEQWAAGNRPVPVRVSDGRLIYAVRSRSYGPACVHCGAVLPPAPAIYIVEQRADYSLACDCPSGVNGAPCWHRAAVMRLHELQAIDHADFEGAPA